MRIQHPVPFIAGGIVGVGLVLLALVTNQRTLVFCWPAILFALAGLVLLVIRVLYQPGDRNA